MSSAGDDGHRDKVGSRFHGSVMRVPGQRGSGLCSIEVDESGVTMRTALRRSIEIKREEVIRVEVRTTRRPFIWYTAFCFVRPDGRRAKHSFVAFRTSALRSTFERFGYAIIDVK